MTKEDIKEKALKEYNEEQDEKKIGELKVLYKRRDELEKCLIEIEAKIDEYV